MSVRFRDLSAVRAHVAAIIDGPTRAQWSAGQIFFHLAAAFELSCEPREASTPVPSRLLKAPVRTAVLRGRIPKGVTIPQELSDRLEPPADARFDAQRDRLLAAIDRFIACDLPNDQRPVHPALGVLTGDEWTTFHMRHCELHLSQIASGD